MAKKVSVKVYHGFGHAHAMTIYGHVFKNKAVIKKDPSNNPFLNLYRLLQLFFVKPFAGIKVQFVWDGALMQTTTATDGFFKFEWDDKNGTIPAGWHTVTVEAVDDTGLVLAAGNGEFFVPHITQYAFISDIDDTVMVSYSSTKFKRLKELLFKNAKTRMVFEGVAEHYRILALVGTVKETPNPFFYVSSSEWNLYDYLNDVFHNNHLPKGAFLLNQLKSWHNIFSTGKTKHMGKLLRIVRIMEAFPNQQFVLLGDSSQSDTAIYRKVIEAFPDRIHSIYIRNVTQVNEANAKLLFEKIDKKVNTFLFNHSSEAIAYGIKSKLINT